MNVTTLQQRAKTLFGLYFLTVFLTVFGIAARAQPGHCLPNKLESNPRQVLTCFLSATAQTTPITWSLLNKERQGTIDIYRYQLTSQVWPDRSLSLQGKPWLHTLTVYVPDQVQSKQSLLILNGGTRYPAAGLQVSKADRFDPLTIAQKTLSTVISLEDLPNQYLRFEDNIERREDG